MKLEISKDIKCCTKHEISNDILLYMCAISRDPINEMTESDQHYLLSMHAHLKSCHNCREMYQIFKDDMFSDTSAKAKNIFTPEALVLTNNNEKALENLFKKFSIN